jgi:hypothetical protein
VQYAGAALGNFALIFFQLTQQETFGWIIRSHFGRHILTESDPLDPGFNTVLPFNLGLAGIVQRSNRHTEQAIGVVEREAQWGPTHVAKAPGGNIGTGIIGWLDLGKSNVGLFGTGEGSKQSPCGSLAHSTVTHMDIFERALDFVSDSSTLTASMNWCREGGVSCGLLITRNAHAVAVILCSLASFALCSLMSMSIAKCTKTRRGGVKN